MKETFYQKIVSDLPVGYAYHELIYDREGRPCDYRFLEINAAFERFTGLGQEKVLGRTICEILPDIRSGTFDWVAYYGMVVKSGERHTFKAYSEPLGRWYQVDAYAPAPDHFITFFSEDRDQLDSIVDRNNLLEALNDMIFILDSELVFLDFLAAEDLELFIPKQQIIGQSISGVFPEPLLSEIKAAFTEALQTGLKTSVSYPSITEGTAKWFRADIKYVRSLKQNRYIVNISDITRQKKMERENAIKEKILRSMVDFTHELLICDDIKDVLITAMRSLGEATETDRVYFWANHYDGPSSQWLTSQKFEWCADQVEPQIDNPDLQDIPFAEVGSFIGPLEAGKPFVAHVRELPPDMTRQILAAQGILSILVLPVFANDQFTGFIGFDACRQEKVWSQIEFSLLRTFSLLLGKMEERKQLEQSIRQTQQNFDNFFSTISDMLFVIDLQGRIIYANQAAARRLGYAEQELIGQPILIAHPPEQAGEVKAKIADMLSGAVESFEIPLQTRSGTKILVETRAVLGEWNGRQAIFGVTKDITELRHSEEMFAKAFHTNGVLMAISSCETGIYSMVNDTFLKTLGYTRDEVIGKSPADLDLFADTKQYSRFSQACSQQETVCNREMKIRDRRGRIHVGLLNAEPIMLKGSPHLLTTMLDITGRKKIEVKLREAKIQAEQATRLKEHFFSAMTHEIRTPMNAVIAYTELMASTALSRQQADWLDKTRTSASLLLKLINHILDFSKLNADALRLDVQCFQLSQVVADALGQVSVLAEKKAIRLEFRQAENMPDLLMGDPVRLQQILVNLLDNAVKFTEKGSVTLAVRLEEEKPDEVVLRFSVQDTGIGIDPGQLKFLFDPFVQANIHHPKGFGGTGLGLSICKQLVELYGGRIWAESQPGTGSVFTCTLPFKPAARPACQSRATGQETAAASQAMLDLGGMRALVVEDNEINRAVMQDLLATARIAVSLAENGLDALARLETQSYDLVLMDIRMPGIDGIETTQRIRQDSRWRHLPVIAVTASGDFGQLSGGKLKSYGFNDVVIKPVTRTSLVSAILRSLDKDRQQLAPDDPQSEADKQMDPGADQTGRQLFSHLPGIDPQLAGSRFGDNPMLFRRIMEKLHQNHGASGQQLVDLCDTGQLVQAVRLAHTLKGISATIGAEQAARLAGQLEAELGDGRIDSGLLQQFCAEWSRVLEGSAHLAKPAEAEPEQAGQVPDPLAVHELIKKAVPLLEEHDQEALPYMHLLLEQIRHQVKKDLYAKLKNAVSQYDFAAMTRLLAKIRLPLE